MINKKMLFIFFLAFIIRLIYLNQSLWLDEATTAIVVQKYTFLEIVTKFSPHDFHPPLYYLFMKVWTNIFGYAEIFLRMPSILFSLLTGYVVYLIGKRIKNENIGTWSSVFFLFNPLIIYYSQEARMYLLATCLLTVTLYHFLTVCHPEFVSKSKLKASGNKLGLTEVALFGLSVSVSFLAFYGSIFLIVPMFLYLIYKKRYSNFLISCFMFCVTCLVLSPLFLSQLANAHEQLQLVANWENVLGTLNLKNLFLVPMKFSVGRISFYPKWLYWGVSGLWTLFVWFFVFKGGLKNKSLLFLLLGSLVLGILFSIFTPLLQYFRFLYLVPIISVLLALGLATFHRSGGMWLVVTGFILLSFTYLVSPQFHREDWKSLAKTLPQNEEIFMVTSSSDPLTYYRKEITITDLRSINDVSLGSHIIVLPYTADIYGINYQGALEKRRYQLYKKSSFRELQVEYWQKTP